MPDALRIMSRLPVPLAISESHPNPERPGDSPTLKQAVIRPGMNTGIDAELFGKWAAASGKDFVASSDAIAAGATDGKVYVMGEDEPAAEYGFEIALKRATEAGASDAAQGSTQTDPGPVKAEDMKPGSQDASGAAPVLASVAPLKVPMTADASAPPKSASTPTK